MESSQDTAKKLTGAAAIVMAATLLSRVIGFLRTLFITTNMMPQGYSDEFLLAFTLPDLVYDLLAGGAIAAAMIPVLSTYLTKGNEKTGWKAISTFMNLTVIVLLILEVIFFVFTDQLLGVLAAGYNTGSSGDKDLLIRLTRILLLSAPFMMMAGQFNGVLNSYKQFTAAAFGPVVYNICTVLSIAIFGAKSAELTAWGVVFGAVVFFIIQFFATREHFTFYRPKLYIKNLAFKDLIHLAIPSLLSSTILEVNLIISRGYATYYEEGMVTLLTSANRTWQLPLGIFAQSIGVALLPTLSEHFASSSKEEFKNVLYKGLKVVYLLSLPTTIIMMILSSDIIRVMFKWGNFSEQSVFYGGLCLMGYSAALVFASVITLMTRGFYAIHDSKTPLIAGFVSIFVNYLFNIFFINFTAIGIAGTALAYSLQSFVNMMILLFAFKKKTGIDILYENFGYIFKAIGAAIPASLVTYGISIVFRPGIGKASQVICAVVPILAGLGVYWIILMKINIREVEFVNNLILSKLRRKKPIDSKN